MPLKYLSVCSGIEAATVAWHPLGFQAIAFSEVESFPSALLAHHYPTISNLGDMRSIDGRNFRGMVDILVGGTPCQSFSVAGLRQGLQDARGNLALEFVRIAQEADPAFIVWENVPGVLIDRGNAFGCFIAGLAGEDAPLLPPGGRWKDAGYVLGPQRAVCWRILDAQYFGLAQRRRRVFLIACPRDGFDPCAILFEFDSMRRDSAPCREAGTEVAGTLKSCAGSGSWANSADYAAAGYMRPVTGAEMRELPQVTQSLTGGFGAGGPDDSKAQGGFYIACFGGGKTSGSIGRAPTLTARGGGMRLDFDTDMFIARTLRAEGFDASEDGTGKQNLVAARGGSGTTPLAFTERGRPEGRTLEMQRELAYALTNPGSGGRTHSRQILDTHAAVRRLTPRECERLQGFPDDYTLIPYKRLFAVLPKPVLAQAYARYLRRMHRQKKSPVPLDELVKCADGPRYKALGNSMAVPVMRWIGARILEHVREQY